MTGTINRLKALVSEVLQCDILELSVETGLLRHLNWDSLAHVSIISRVETDFHVTIPDEQIETLNTIGAIWAFIDQNVAVNRSDDAAVRPQQDKSYD